MTLPAPFRTIGIWFLLITLLSATVAMAAAPRMIAAIYVQGKVGLKWQEVSGVEEYTVYRKAANEEFEAIMTISTISGGQWFDETIVPGTSYTYRIGAVVDGTEVFSGEKSVSVPAGVTGFSAPKWTGSRVDGPRIMLNWDPVPTAIAYNIFRSETPGGPYESIASSQSNRYADTDGLERGASYYYVVTALNAEFEETPQSEEQEIKFGISAQEIAAQEAEQIVLVPVSLTQRDDLSRPEIQPMNQPSDLFVVPAGDVYVVDSLNGQVHCFDSGGGYKFSFGSKAYVHEGRVPLDGTFAMPMTIFVDGQGRVYVADVKREDIQVFSAEGDFLRKISPELGDGMAGLRATGMHVFDDGSIVVSDTGNHRMLFLDAQGAVRKSVGKHGGGPAEFNFPGQLVVTDEGEIFVVDIMNFRVQVLDLEGNYLRAFGQPGQSAGTFARPSGIAVDAEGNVWITDKMSGMVQKFTGEGEVVSVIGTNLDEIRFSSPYGVCLTDTSLYVVNRLGNKVSVFTLQ
jgi:sugar lactone lactonase YvrE